MRGRSRYQRYLTEGNGRSNTVQSYHGRLLFYVLTCRDNGGEKKSDCDNYFSLGDGQYPRIKIESWCDSGSGLNISDFSCYTDTRY